MGALSRWVRRKLASGRTVPTVLAVAADPEVSPIASSLCLLSGAALGIFVLDLRVDALWEVPGGVFGMVLACSLGAAAAAPPAAGAAVATLRRTAPRSPPDDLLFGGDFQVRLDRLEAALEAVRREQAGQVAALERIETLRREPAGTPSEVAELDDLAARAQNAVTLSAEAMAEVGRRLARARLDSLVGTLERHLAEGVSERRLAALGSAVEALSQRLVAGWIPGHVPTAARELLGAKPGGAESAWISDEAAARDAHATAGDRLDLLRREIADLQRTGQLAAVRSALAGSTAPECVEAGGGVAEALVSLEALLESARERAANARFDALGAARVLPPEPNEVPLSVATLAALRGAERAVESPDDESVPPIPVEEKT